MLTIIIPTLNEEENIKNLITAIKKDDVDNLDEEYEILIADAGSKDKTKEIAESLGAVVIKGGLPAVGRNIGAKQAKGDILLFIDADLKFSKGFIAKSLKEFHDRNLDVASYSIYPQVNNVILNRFTLDMFYNVPAKVLKKIFPMGAMGIMVKKSIFDEVGGFDEDIALAEDHYFMGQAAKIGNFGIFKTGKIYMPVRRFEQDGYIKTPLKYLMCAVYMNLYGRKGLDKFSYEFDHYEEEKK